MTTDTILTKRDEEMLADMPAPRTSRRVVTYRLAYLSDRRVDLCDACVEADDHDCGTLGPVSHGRHEGDCDGRHHDHGCRGPLHGET